MTNGVRCDGAVMVAPTVRTARTTSGTKQSTPATKSATGSFHFTVGASVHASLRSIDHRGVHQRLQLVPEVERARRDQLGHEDDGQLLGWVDPENRRRVPAPREVAGRTDDAGPL